MSSVQRLREFFSETLTTAAEEIFRVFEQTIVEYEEQIDRQRQLLDIVLKPQIKLHRTELPQQHFLKEEEVLTEQQLCNQERTSSPDQVQPEPPQMKEEPAGLSISQEEEQLVRKLEADTSMLTPANEESEHGEPEANGEPEASGDDQLLSANCPVAECQDQEGSAHVEPKLTRNIEKKRKRRHHTDNLDASLTTKINRSSQTGELAFKCDICGKVFICQSKLITHLRYHSRETHCSCETCGKILTNKSSLQQHMKIHTGERPYLCTTCGKRFIQKVHLQDHIRTHTGEKPYHCTTCEIRFSRTSTLQRHLIIHTGEKLYPCGICGKEFSQKVTLRQHLRLHR